MLLKWIMGNVLGAGLGQNVARQMSVNAGYPCIFSSIQSIKYVVRVLKLFSYLHKLSFVEMLIFVAGGAENMSQAPYVLQTTLKVSRRRYKSD